MEAKDLGNVGKTKVMTGCEGFGTIEEFGDYLCGVCDKGVGDNGVTFVIYYFIWLLT